MADLSEGEAKRGMRLIARADRVISAMHAICDWHGLACMLALGTLMVALYLDDRRLAVAAALSVLLVQVVHVGLHIKLLARELLTLPRACVDLLL